MPFTDILSSDSTYTPNGSPVLLTEVAQTISTFPPIDTQSITIGSFLITIPTSSRGLPVTVEVVSGPATISGNLITLTGDPGVVVLEAYQKGDSYNLPATPITTSFNTKGWVNGSYYIGNSVTSLDQNGNGVWNGDEYYNGVKRLSQSITLPSVSDQIYGNTPLSINATASSGLPVTLSILSGPATITGGLVTLTGPGQVILAANQTGNNYYFSAPQATTSFSVAKRNQTITVESGEIYFKGFLDDNNHYMYLALFDWDEPLFSDGIYDSNPVVSYVSSAPPYLVDGHWIWQADGTGNATIIESTGAYATIYPVGTIATVDSLINAGWPPFGPYSSDNTTDPTGRSCYSTLYESVYIDPTTTTAISIEAKQGSSVSLIASSSSGLPVSFSLISGQATLNGSTLTLTGVGDVVVQASQAGNDNYNAAPSVSQSFSIVPIVYTSSGNGWTATYQVDNTGAIINASGSFAGSRTYQGMSVTASGSLTNTGWVGTWSETGGGPAPNPAIQSGTWTQAVGSDGGPVSDQGGEILLNPGALGYVSYIDRGPVTTTQS